MKKIIGIIISVLLAVLIFILLIGDFSARTVSGTTGFSELTEKYTYDKNPVYKSESEKFMRYEGNSNIVMLGNSITSQADWTYLLGRNDVLNRGISGDITEGMLRRLVSVIKVKPSICFLMCGINDITRRVPYEETLSNIKTIAQILKTNGIIPVIQSVLYTESRFFSSEYNNPIVTELNDDLIKFCGEENIDFIDLNRFLSENNSLKPEYTDDGLHLNAKGYEVWSKVLNSYLKLNGK